MDKIYAFLGGRKMVLIFTTIILIACSKWIGLDAETLNKLIVVALGGSGVVALEDSAKAFAGKKKKTTKK